MKTPPWLETDHSQAAIIVLFLLGIALILIGLWT
jgi:hypothetical protein